MSIKRRRIASKIADKMLFQDRFMRVAMRVARIIVAATDATLGFRRFMDVTWGICSIFKLVSAKCVKSKCTLNVLFYEMNENTAKRLKDHLETRIFQIPEFGNEKCPVDVISSKAEITGIKTKTVNWTLTYAYTRCFPIAEARNEIIRAKTMF